MLSFCCAGPAMAEDPIIVHYSDPSLARLEKQPELRLLSGIVSRTSSSNIVIRSTTALQPMEMKAIRSRRVTRDKSTDAAEKVVRGFSVAVDEMFRVKKRMSWRRF